MRNQLFIAALAAGLLLSATAYAQTCTSTITSSAPNSRYTNNGDGTVTDNTTGLMWKQCPEGLSTSSTACDTGYAIIYTWQQALQHAQTVDSGGGFAGHTDWRVPNRNELASLVETQCTSPSINTAFFPIDPNDTGELVFWSSSTTAFAANNAWGVNFSTGSDGAGGIKSFHFYVRLVRGGQ